MRWIAIWTVLVCTGCLISTSGLSGGSGQVADAGAVDPVLDAGNDASGAVDPVLDAGDASVPFCKSLVPKPAFCADFDESSDVKAGWQDSVRSSGGGAQALDGTTSTSGGHSLATTLPAGMATNSVGSTIGATLGSSVGTTPADHITVDFDLRFEAGDSNAYAQVVTLFLGDYYDVHLLVNENAVLLQEDIVIPGDSSYPQTPVAAMLAPSTWTHVRIDVEFGATYQITVSIGDAPPLVHPMATGASNGILSMDVGAVYYVSHTVSATSIHQDNVVVRME